MFAVAKTEDKKQVVLRLDLDNGSTEFCVKLPLNFKHRRVICPTENFALYCKKRGLVILPYKDVQFKGVQSYTFNKNFNGVDPDSISFSSVTVVKNSVFAVLNFGQILYWWVLSKIFYNSFGFRHGVNENGLANNQHSFIHAHYTEPCIAVTSLLAIFCGTANSRVDKWNAVTTGSGKYERFQVMERMDAPVQVLWLSSDSNYLLAILSDNSMVILNSVSLAVVSRPPSLHWPAFYNPLDWLGLCTDIEHPDYVVTNTRTGYIQWVDPTKWRTFGEVILVAEDKNH